MTEPDESGEKTWSATALVRQLAISRVDSVFESVLTDLLHERPVTIRLRRRTTRQQARTSAGVASTNFHEDHAPQQSISFPGATPEEAWKFCVVFEVLGIVHKALVDNSVVSKRDIYYGNTALYGNQAVVDRVVDDIAFTFGVSRTALHIAAAAKGLVMGPLQIHGPDSSRIDCSHGIEGTLIPTMNSSNSYDTTQAQCILVVEKEAVFRNIISSQDIWPRVSRHCIIVTGKGYPDMATRALMHGLTTQTEIPAYALVDFDPDGVAILSTYKYGSSSLAHEASRLVAPSLRWMGLHTAHLVRHAESVPLTSRDRRKAASMLSWANFAERGSAGDGSFPAERRELQVMLMLNIKAELESLYKTPEGFGSWLCHQIGLGMTEGAIRPV